MLDSLLWRGDLSPFECEALAMVRNSYTESGPLRSPTGINPLATGGALGVVALTVDVEVNRTNPPATV